MTEITKNRIYLNTYLAMGQNALNEIKTLCKRFNLSTICLGGKDIYIHYHTNNSGGVELKLATLTYDPTTNKIILTGGNEHFLAWTNVYDIDLEDDCLLLDCLYIYEALVDYINENIIEIEALANSKPKKYYYKIDIPGSNGYSIMVSSSTKIDDEREVIERALYACAFECSSDSYYAEVDNLVSDYDIDFFKSNNRIIDLDD